MTELLNAYNVYTYREYEKEPTSWGQFIDMILLNKGIIYIAYTEDETGTPMQCAYDLKNEEYITLYNGEEKERTKVPLECFINDLLFCVFDDFIRECWKYAQEEE